MKPFILRSERLVLDQPTQGDIDDIARYCTDPMFERFMATPWPYEREHAEFFVDDYVPNGWARDEEWTWAIRDDPGEPLRGVVGVRLRSGMIGYWLGAAHRGRGIMPEAVSAVVDAVFSRTDRDDVLWECVVHNQASMRVAEKAGFSYTGQGPGLVPARDGSIVEAWHATLGRSDSRERKPGWPAAE